MTESRKSRYLTTDDPEWLAHAAEFWEERYNAQHRTLHRAEDEIARLREAAQAVVNAVDPLTPKEWAFETPTAIREAIIALEDVLADRNLSAFRGQDR